MIGRCRRYECEVVVVGASGLNSIRKGKGFRGVGGQGGREAEAQRLSCSVNGTAAGSCRYRRMSVHGGRIAAKVVCCVGGSVRCGEIVVWMWLQPRKSRA